VLNNGPRREPEPAATSTSSKGSPSRCRSWSTYRARVSPNSGLTSGEVRKSPPFSERRLPVEKYPSSGSYSASSMNSLNGIGPVVSIWCRIRRLSVIRFGKMKFGVFIFPMETAIRPDDLAREVEARGFHSLWFPEHSHIPASRATPWGGQVGAPPLPDHYWRSHEAFIALSHAAAVTSNLRLGTGVSLVAQRDPIWTAKEVASLDALSGGRLIFGVGYGWNKEEMAQHGVDYAERRALLREKVLLMKALWTEDEAAFEGEMVSLEPSWAWPKPAQRPHPPIIMGAAAGPRTVADMVEFCDGWMPLATRMDIVGEVGRVREAVADAGRDPGSFEVIAYGARPDDIDKLIEAGIDHTTFNLRPLPPAETIPYLDRLAGALGLT
jgi:probable F420-dependent oxidoreductase